MSLKQAVVFKSTGSWYLAKADDGFVELRLKGKIRLQGIKSTNPVAVGDIVSFDPVSETIVTIEKRNNYLIRRSNNLSKYSHIIAANIDMVLLITSFKSPRTSRGFIDRFIMTCEAYDLEVVIVVNKTDQLTEEDQVSMEEMMATYEQIGYKVVKISALEERNWKSFEALIENKTTLFSGHSGVGKSTIINKLLPRLSLKTGDVSEVNYKGKHTTTFAEMFEVNDDTRIIDTPGIKDFGLVNMEREEISHYFREMAPLLEDCKFSNCLHLKEPGCAVTKAVEEGEIDGHRYYSYISILEGDEEVNNPDYLWRKTL